MLFSLTAAQAADQSAEVQLVIDEKLSSLLAGINKIRKFQMPGSYVRTFEFNSGEGTKLSTDIYVEMPDPAGIEFRHFLFDLNLKKIRKTTFLYSEDTHVAKLVIEADKSEATPEDPEATTARRIEIIFTQQNPEVEDAYLFLETPKLFVY